MNGFKFLPDSDGGDFRDRYHLFSQVGRGGMGETYRAWDKRSGRPVVIKRPKRALLEKPDFLERFDREVRTMRRLQHPHIVPVIDAGVFEDLPFYVMPFLPGGSLYARRLRDDAGQPLPESPGTLHLWLPDIATALDHLHAQGIVHRDVKPANILFDVSWHARLSDFGIAKVVDETGGLDREETLTATHMAVGTQEYMAPEQFAPKPVLAGTVDQYALAVTLYDLLAGRRPFIGESAHVIVEITAKDPPPLGEFRKDLPATLVQAVHRGLAKRPQDRFPTCSDFARAALVHIRPVEDEPDIVRLSCPQCSKIIRISSKDAGRSGACPKCAKRLVIADDFSALWMLSEQSVVTAPTGGRQPAEPIEHSADVRRSDPSGAFDFTPLSKPSPVTHRPPGQKQRVRQAAYATLALVATSIAAIFIAVSCWPSPPPPIAKDPASKLPIDDGKLVVFSPKGFSRSPKSSRTDYLVEYTPDGQIIYPRIRVYAGGDPPGSAREVVLDRGPKRPRSSGMVWESTAEKGAGDIERVTAMKCAVTVGRAPYTVEVATREKDQPKAETMCRLVASWLEAGRGDPPPPPPAGGFQVEYFADRNLSSRIDYPDKIWALPLEFDSGRGAPVARLPADNFSIRWQGHFLATQKGRHQFRGTCDDGLRIKIQKDGKWQTVVDSWRDRTGAFNSEVFYLLKGKQYLIVIEYYEGKADARLKVEWKGELGTWKVLGPDDVSPSPRRK